MAGEPTELSSSRSAPAPEPPPPLWVGDSEASGSDNFGPAVPNRTRQHVQTLQELSVGDVVEIDTGARREWLACDPFGWRPIDEPANRSGEPLSTATVYQRLTELHTRTRGPRS